MSCNKTSLKCSSESIVKNEIIQFLKIFKQVDLKTNYEFITIIKGGIIQGVKVDGFLKLKEKIANLMKIAYDNKSLALDYINNHIN
jgi:hypothetical protein